MKEFQNYQNDIQGTPNKVHMFDRLQVESDCTHTICCLLGNKFVVEGMSVCQVVLLGTGNEELSVSFVKFYFLKGLFDMF